MTDPKTECNSRKLHVDAELYRTDISDTFNVSDIVYMDTNGNAFKLR